MSISLGGGDFGARACMTEVPSSASLAGLLTAGAIERMLGGAESGSKVDLSPVLRVTGISKVAQNGRARYLLQLTDGVRLQLGVLSWRKNDLVESQTLVEGSYIRVSEFTSYVSKGRSALIIIDLEVVRANSRNLLPGYSSDCYWSEGEVCAELGLVASEVLGSVQGQRELGVAGGDSSVFRPSSSLSFAVYSAHFDAAMGSRAVGP